MSHNLNHRPSANISADFLSDECHANHQATGSAIAIRLLLDKMRLVVFLGTLANEVAGVSRH